MEASFNPDPVLLRVESGLLEVQRIAEESVSALVHQFRTLTERSETVLRQASSIVECVEGERVAAVLPQVGELGAIARKYIQDRLQATSGILETVGSEVELLLQLEKITEGQSKTAKRIKALNIFTRIEVAHLGEIGAGFDYLARELADFSQSLVQNTNQLGRQTHERKVSIERTKQMLARDLPVLRHELTRVENSLEEDLRVLDAGLASLAETPMRFQGSASALDGKIAGVVMAVQGHDITRQQIEHVCEGARLIRERWMASQGAEPGAALDLPSVYAGLAVQAAQLRAVRQTLAEWSSQIEACVASILTISASELVEIGPMVREQEQSLIAHLGNIEMLEKECISYSEKIHDTLEGISNLSQLVTEHMKKSESARSRLQLLTFNSIVEATRLGSQADTICVIADDIAAVSGAWSQISERSASALDGILRISAEISEIMSAFAGAGDESLNESQRHTRVVLEGLREAAAFAESQGKAIAAVAEEMQARSKEIRLQAEQLHSCRAQIDAEVDGLDGLIARLIEHDPGLRDRVDGAEIESLFGSSYTTESERNVLRATVYGAEAVASAPSAACGEIELF